MDPKEIFHMGRVPWHLRRMDDVFGKEYGERSLGKYP